MTVGEIVVKTATSVIPVGGTLISCVIDEIKSKSMQKRQEEWMNMIEGKISKIKIDMQTIGENEKFTSAIIKATEVALKTSEKQKREYLANAVINSINFSADESVLMIYIELIERYTVWHLQILEHFQCPERGIGRDNEYMGGAELPLYRRYPHMRDRKDLVTKIIKDFQNDGLLHDGDFWRTTMTANGIYAKRTTELGDGFLKFIL